MTRAEILALADRCATHFDDCPQPRKERSFTRELLEEAAACLRAIAEGMNDADPV